MTTFEKVAKIFDNQMGIDHEEVKPESRIVEDFHADSLDIVEISLSLEDEFNMDFPDEIMENIKTIQDIVDYVEKNK